MIRVTSLGYQTDLALLELGGSRVEDRGDYLVIRSPHNPTHWWGNFLLLAGPPPREDSASWIDAFGREFGRVSHIALGFDGVDGTVEQLGGFAEAGLHPETAAVMTARAVTGPSHPQRDADYRALTSDTDWQQRVELRVAGMDAGQDPAAFRAFAEAQSDTMRELTEAGHGRWFGAFVDGQLRSSMGLFRAGPGLARFQAVETHPDARGRGLAGTLVHHVSCYGLDHLGAHTLVMVADPHYAAIRVYRSLGFAETETQLQAESPL